MAALQHRSRAVEGHDGRVLLVQSAPLGDTAQFIAAAGRAGLLGGDADVVCEPSMVPLWRSFSTDSIIVPHDFRIRPASTMKRDLSVLADRRYSTVAVATMSKRAAYVSAFVETGRRVGLVQKPAYTAARLLLDESYAVFENEHVSNRYDRLLSGQKGNSVPGVPSPVQSAGCAIHPGGKWVPRRWPAPRYLKLAFHLADLGVPVQIIIWEKETDLMDFFGSQTLPEGVSIRRTITLQDLLDCVSESRLVIGNDSGPVHLASLLGKDVICVWGPGNHHRIAPSGEKVRLIMHPRSCRPCRQYKGSPPCGGGTGACLLDIPEEEVLRAAEEVVGGWIGTSHYRG